MKKINWKKLADFLGKAWMMFSTLEKWAKKFVVVVMITLVIIAVAGTFYVFSKVTETVSSFGSPKLDTSPPASINLFVVLAIALLVLVTIKVVTAMIQSRKTKGEREKDGGSKEKTKEDDKKPAKSSGWFGGVVVVILLVVVAILAWNNYALRSESAKKSYTEMEWQLCWQKVLGDSGRTDLQAQCYPARVLVYNDHRFDIDVYDENLARPMTVELRWNKSSAQFGYWRQIDLNDESYYDHGSWQLFEECSGCKRFQGAHIDTSGSKITTWLRPAKK